MKHFKIFILLLCICAGCSQPSKLSPTFDEHPIPLSHARGFTIAEADSFTVVTVNNPWKEATALDRYYLVRDEATEVPADGQKVKIPIESLMTNSATYLGFLDALGQLDKVVGVCNANYIYNPTILKGVEEGSIKDLGDSFNLDIESLLLLNPQAVMTTAYNADDANSKRMKQTGLTILYNVEWQEPSILGRAEWIKFIGCFFDKRVLADSLFAHIEQKYQDAKMLAANTHHRPTIFSGQDYRGTWSFAGGKSYTAQLFRDANASYLYENDSTTASIAGNIEQALLNFSEADLWIGTQEPTLPAMIRQNSKYKLFKAFKNGEVYNMNKRINSNGGNDYWESAVARPDLLLMDMIKICHPEVLPQYQLTYFDKLTHQ